jgi:two-component system sensor histidine kinase TctE
LKSRTPASNPLSLLVEILDWLLAGDRELAEIFPEEAQAQHIVYFRDAEWHDDPVRVAYMFMFEPQAPHRRVVVQVGETLNKRKRLSNEIIAGIIIPQFFLFPVVALLAWFGLQRGTLPLERLRQRLLSRRPGDLSPINVREVPEEVAPLIEAFNGVMERLSTTMRAQERFIADAAHPLRTPLAKLHRNGSSRRLPSASISVSRARRGRR